MMHTPRQRRHGGCARSCRRRGKRWAVWGEGERKREREREIGEDRARNVSRLGGRAAGRDGSKGTQGERLEGQKETRESQGGWGWKKRGRESESRVDFISRAGCRFDERQMGVDFLSEVPPRR